MSEQLERDVRFLKRYATMSTAAMVILGLTAFTRSAPTRFDEIDVQRINVVEPNGLYRMVISNRPRSIGPVYKGKPFGYAGGGRPGIIFFNDEGTENGGLTFTGSRKPDGTYSASTHMSFDQFDQDQVLNLDYNEENGHRVTGFSVNDRAAVNIYDWVNRRDSIQAIRDSAARAAAMAELVAPRNGVPLNARRMFLGKDDAKNATLNLYDPNGRIRLRLSVDSLGTPRLEFLDANGRPTLRLPST